MRRIPDRLAQSRSAVTVAHLKCGLYSVAEYLLAAQQEQGMKGSLYSRDEATKMAAGGPGGADEDDDEEDDDDESPAAGTMGQVTMRTTAQLPLHIPGQTQ